MAPVRRLALILLLSLVWSCGPREGAEKAPPIQGQAAPRLEQFGSEAEFARYLRTARDAAEKQFRRNAPAMAEAPAPMRAEAAPADAAVSEAAPSASGADAATITNTQKAGVDEGDIVKRIGRFLIVLQDGRLFTVDTGARDGGGLRVADRIDVYRRRAETWYDEMLIYRNRILVTGYNYGEGATEFSLFLLGETGDLTREATYFLTSHDYYSTNNYATRLVEDKLVIYSPLFLPLYDPKASIDWPLMRRWVREIEGRNVLSNGARLIDPREIYKPVQPAIAPIVHTVSICPLGAAIAGDELACRSIAFIGPPQRELYVSRTHAYLWVSSHPYEFADWDSGYEACKSETTAPFAEAMAAALYRVPLAGGAPQVMMVRGAPVNQFGLDTSDAEFRALLTWESGRCYGRGETPTLKYFHAPLRAFDEAVSPSEQHYADLPGPGGYEFENRFTDAYLVYGGGRRWSYDDEGRARPNPLSARVVAVPVDNPSAPAVMEAPHSILRIERAGANVVLTGYGDGKGLNLSLVDLRNTPRIADTIALAGRYESEGRSHAFNSLVRADGSGILGLPTVAGADVEGRAPWRSDASDVTFLSLDAMGALRPIGSLDHRQRAHPAYKCEVSCIDWYGNSRPIFMDGRIFGLTGVELIEGALANGRIEERRRVNLTAPPG